MEKVATTTAKKTLNDIIKQYQELEERLIESGGALDDELEGALAENAESLGHKLDGYAGFIGYLKGQIEYLKSEAEHFASRAKTFGNSIDAMRARMAFAMETTGESKIKTADHSYSIRTTESWKLKDIDKDTEEELIDEGLGEYQFKADMKAIKGEYKDSEPPSFIDVTQKVSITIR